jgi:cyclic pyranopterin phosphate synthase
MVRKSAAKSPAKLTHLDESGNARMVDISSKPITRRTATAEGFITMQHATLQAIAFGKVPKGEVLNTARIAGIMAAKRCGELIPLCHPLPIDAVHIEFDGPEADIEQGSITPARLRIRATATITAKTGVEMEALTAVTVAALTIYDMCKAIDRSMTITEIRLLEKFGGTHAWPSKPPKTVV